METTHFIAVTRHDGLARPQTPSTYSRLQREARPMLGGSIDLPRLDGQRGSSAALLRRFPYFGESGRLAGAIRHHIQTP